VALAYTDQTHHTIQLADIEHYKVVSIVPSQTELLYYLGSAPIAQTKFCVHPRSQFKTSIKIGGTKKEENNQSDIEELRKHVPVWLSDIYTLDDALDMIRSIGVMVKKKDQADLLVRQIQDSFKKLEKLQRKSCLYVVWNKPIMAVGRNTFIHSMLTYAGYKNSIQEEDSRYPELTEAAIKRLNPDTVLLSSEPFPFKEEHIRKFQSLLPMAEVKLVDGEMFSWYGNRLLGFASYLTKMNSNNSASS
jgi:ABC-type Fe3+-hydroxamate transport system substrate-binding protein